MGGNVYGMTTKIGDLIMVNLDTSDPAGAAEFYGKVLGWEVTDMSGQLATLTEQA